MKTVELLSRLCIQNFLSIYLKTKHWIAANLKLKTIYKLFPHQMNLKSLYIYKPSVNNNYYNKAFITKDCYKVLISNKNSLNLLTIDILPN